MAGLQYNFFPTDFFYPRPVQSTPPADATPPAALTMQSQKTGVADDTMRPASMVHQGNKTSVSMRRQGEKLGRIYFQNRGEQVKLPQNSLSWLIVIPEELSDSS
ncbi:hypothetical protein QQP08_016018 [Theobroma cacao]|nr:hypothetical protein QQP08_016018 [Theobroma cacao]